MAYLLFLLANAALFVRPAELLPSLENLQIYLALIASAAVAGVEGIRNQLRPRTLIQQPINLCVVGMILAAPLSTMTSSLDFGTAMKGFVDMAKVGVYYLMLVSVINTPQRFRQFLVVTAICSTILVGASILDFQKFKQRWQGSPFIWEQMQADREVSFDKRVLTHVIDSHGTNAMDEPNWVFRMRGLGIFNDPNDVALLIGVSLAIAVYFLSDKRLSVLRFLWTIPIVILCYGYVQTESRGGLLAIGAAGMVWMAFKYGGKVAMVIGAMGIMAAPLMLGRAADMDVSGGSGQERIQIWGEGLEAIKSKAILTGVGQDKFYEIAGHVAHNSYVHAYVELGFIGGTVFLGCFFIAGLALIILRQRRMELRDEELRRLLPYVAAILTTWCVGMFSLSRNYVISTYMICGLCAAYINLAGFYLWRPRPIVVFDRPVMQRLVACSAVLLVSSFIFVRLFAKWSS
ncbi:MAG: O-antigen ligase family protein [Planctomycetaceae bacterium]